MEDTGKILEPTAPSSTSSALEVESHDHPRINYKGGVTMAKSSNLQASFTLFKTFIGTGVLALPYSFKTAGLGLSLTVIVAVSLLTSYAFFLLLNAANDKVGQKETSLQKLTQEILGDKGKHAVQISMMIMQLGCCTGALIFTRNFLNHVLCEFNVEALCDNLAFNLFFALSLAVPLCMINNMHYFYIPSLAANFFILIGLSVQMFYNLDLLDQNPAIKETIGENLGQFNILNLPLFFGVATYAFEGVGVIFSIRNSMETPQDFPKLLKKQMIILTIIYAVFPAVSMIAIGDRLQDIVFFSLPTDNAFYVLIQILYAVSALFSFPVQLFPALRIIENSKALRYRLFNETGRTKNKKLRYGVRLVLIGLIFLVAYCANSFHLFLNLLGSCVFTFLGYILPIWLYQKQFQGKIKMRTRIVNYAVVLVSMVLGSIGFVMSLIKMVEIGEGGSE